MPKPSHRMQLRRYLKTHCIRTGRIRLASGKISDFYMDGRVATLDAVGNGLVARILYDRIKRDRLHAVGGPTMGADPIVSGILARSYDRKRPMKGFLIRKAAKSHGTGRRIEGPTLPCKARVAIVDDVATSGGSLLQALDVIATMTDWKVVRVLCIVDRQEGAACALTKRGYLLESIFQRDELL